MPAEEESAAGVVRHERDRVAAGVRQFDVAPSLICDKRSRVASGLYTVSHRPGLLTPSRPGP